MKPRSIAKGLGLLAAALIAAGAQAGPPPASTFAEDVFEQQDQRAAAEDGLREWIDNFSLSGAAVDSHFMFDVGTLDELKSVRLGQGFALEVLDAAALLEGASASAALRDSGQWRYVVLLGERAVGLVDVRKTGRHYAVTALGAKDLADRIATALQAHPGKRARFVRSYELTADFLRLEDADGAATHSGAAATARFVPLYAERGADASLGVRKADGDSTPAAAADEGAFSANLRALVARSLR